ncbi:MAG: hypothetical protein AABW49_03310 [Nanoarchaeota archaeon]
MTLCIGALCDNGNRIVLTGDRRVSTTLDALTFKLPQPKIVIVGSFGLSFAGRPYPELTQSISREAGKNKPGCFDEFSELVKRNYYRFREKKMEEYLLNILPPALIANFVGGDGSYSKEELQQLLAKYNLEAEFILSGFDSNGVGHLTRLQDDNPATASPFDSFDSVSWLRIGAGNIASHYIANRINPSDSLNKMVYTLFSAHQHCSDTVGCISREVDIVVLGIDGSYRLNDKKIAKLKAIYKLEQRENARSLEEALKKASDIKLLP